MATNENTTYRLSGDLRARSQSGRTERGKKYTYTYVFTEQIETAGGQEGGKTVEKTFNVAATKSTFKKMIGVNLENKLGLMCPRGNDWTEKKLIVACKYVVNLCRTKRWGDAFGFHARLLDGDARLYSVFFVLSTGPSNFVVYGFVYA